MTEYSVVGKPIVRADATSKATGKAVFAADVKLAGTLFGWVLRSPHPHARILHIDTNKAKRLPGVRIVITGSDLPDERHGMIISDRYIMARDKVRFQGEAVAAVAAISEDIAAEAAELIEVDYDDLPGVFDPVEAMNPDAPLIHEEMDSYTTLFPVELKGNVCYHFQMASGDAGRALDEADHVFEDTFKTPMVHQGYIEPHAAIASADVSGKITVWTTTQGQFGLRQILSRMLKVPLTSIRIIPTEIGGGFGGKNDPLIAHICILLSQRAGKPVKIVMTREDEFLAGHPRHPSVIEVRTGVKNDGTITARQAKVIFDTGAYSDFGPFALMSGTMAMRGPYTISNTAFDGFCVYTNKPSCGAYRAPGTPQATFAFETQMDIIAETLGMDALELRMKNGVAAGDPSVAGVKLERSSFHDVLQSAAESIEWGKPSGRNRGKGIACGQWPIRGSVSSATVKMNEDGTIGVLTGSVDLTGSNTILAQIAAEVLTVPIESVSVVTGDTDSAMQAPPSAGSMTAYNMGNAVKLAAADVRDQLFNLASEQMGTSNEQLLLEDGRIFLKDDPDKGMTIRDLAQTSLWADCGLIVGKGSSAPLPPTLAIAAQGVEVEVDPETGKVNILKLGACQDVGFALNPMSVEGQIHGGVTQGIGFALSEQVVFDEGRIANGGFMDYRIPTAQDVPRIQPMMVELASERGPYGAKGVGEPPTVPTAAAIGNAIYNATGVRIKDLPITPEKIVAALKEKKP